MRLAHSRAGCMPYLGEIAALTTALCWLGSSLLFAVAGKQAGAQALNQFRLYAAVPMLAVACLACNGDVWPWDASAPRIAALALSGVVGLVIGDYGYFHALATIGPRLASVIMALWPAFTVAIDAVAGEAPSASQALGVGLTVVGVTMVLAHGRGGAWRPDLNARQWAFGVVGALIGACGQAAGFVVARNAMGPAADLPEGLDPLHATFVRLAAATLGMQLVVAAQGRPFAMRAIFGEGRSLGTATAGTLVGPVLGVWLSMVAGAYARDAGIAAALMATTPVFMLPVSIWLYGARVSASGAVGTLLAGAGVVTCFVSEG